MAVGGTSYDVPEGAKVGVWDQWCVYSDRPYVQRKMVDGKEVEQVSLLNPEVATFILDNFARSKDDLPGNLGHDKHLTVAFYNAFVEVIGGQVTRYATHDPRVPQPTIDQLPGGDDGSPPDDGLYWHRCRLTKLGLTIKPGMRKCSPEFLMDADDPHGEKQGPTACGGAWTNYPFLEGCELNEFEKARPQMATKKSRFERKMEAAGVTETDDDATKMSKLRAYEAGQEAEEERSEMQRRMESGAAAGAEGDREGKDKKPAEMEDPIVTTEAGQPAIKEPPTDQDPVSGGRSMTQGQGGQRQMERGGKAALPAGYVAISEERLRTLEAGIQQLPKVNERLVQMERERTAETTRRTADKAVAAAWKAGQIIPRQDETHAEARDRFMRLYEKGEATFKDALAPIGSFTAPEMMMIEFERVGAGSGNAQPVGGRPDEAIIKLAEARLAEETKAGRQLSRLDAVRLVTMEGEGVRLAAQYANQPYRELGRRMGLPVGV